jgi:hypothetical protein
MDRPSHVYADSNSLWAFYNYVTIALQHSHPKTWMEDQRVLHYFISSIIGSSAPVVPTPVVVESEPVNPNQLSLLDQIAEVEAEEVTNEPVMDGVLQYTDPAGNTFEVPVVLPCAGHDAETEKEIAAEKVVSLEPTPEDYALFEEEEANLDIIAPVVEDVQEAEADFDLDFASDDEDDEGTFEF